MIEAVDLIGAAKGPLHVSGRTGALCGFPVPAEAGPAEAGIDPRVISHKGRRVCGHCRKVLDRTLAEEVTKMSEATDTSKADAVARIVRGFRDEGLTYPALTKALNTEKVPTFGKSAEWHPPVVREIVRRELGEEADRIVAARKDERAAKPKQEAKPKEEEAPAIEVPLPPAKPDPKPKPKPKPRKRARARARATA